MAGTGKYSKSATARFQTFSIRCFLVAFKLLKQHPKTATGLYVILTKKLLTYYEMDSNMHFNKKHFVNPPFLLSIFYCKIAVKECTALIGQLGRVGHSITAGPSQAGGLGGL